MSEHDLRYHASMATPIGQLSLSASDAGITRIGFSRPAPATAVSAPLAAALEQLAAYFAGRLEVFDFPLDVTLRPFQQRVLEAVRRIPYGQTRSYGEIARDIGAPGAARAVGRANHDNPVPIVIPCHRVVGAGGRLTGYAGGLDNKALLLELEQQRAEAA